MYRRLAACLTAICVLAPACFALASDWDEVDALFAAGDLEGARAQVAELEADGPDTLLSLAWRYRLAETPAEAAGVRERLLSHPDLSPAEHDLLLRDAAWAAHADDDHKGALDLLDGIAISEKETAASSGLLGGLAWRARGEPDNCRDALAAVSPDDPDYAWARYHLARLAMAESEAALAQRYLTMAEEAPDSPCRAEVLLAGWMLARESDSGRALRLRRELDHRFPRSLTAALAAEQQQRHDELQQVHAPQDEVGKADGDQPGDERQGRYTLQFAAFTDRANALTYLDRWSPRIPGLHIDAVPDERGGMLYKLRAGAFSGLSQARDQAMHWQDKLGLTPIPLQASDTR